MATGATIKRNQIYSVWTLTDEQQKRFELEESIYERLWRKCNTNCKKAPKTNLNKQLAIETPIFNKDLALKSQVVKYKMDYLFKMWSETDYPMSEEEYDDKIQWYMLHDIKLEFTRESDHKFRHSPQKFQKFRCHLPVIVKVLDKPENQSLKEYLFGSENMNFTFSEEWLESKEAFMIQWGLNVARTETNANCEFNNFLTTCDRNIEFCTSHKDGRLPLGDPYKL